MSRADYRRSSQTRSSKNYAEKLPSLLEGKFMMDPKSGKRIHIDKLGSFTESGHFDMRAHLVGDDDPWQLDSRRPSRNSGETNRTCAHSDEEFQAAKEREPTPTYGRRPSEVSEPEVAAGTPWEENRSVHFERKASLEEEAIVPLRRSSQRRPTPYPSGSTRCESQRYADLEPPQPPETCDEVEVVIDDAGADGRDVLQRTSRRASSQRSSGRTAGRMSAGRLSGASSRSRLSGVGEASARRFSCGKESRNASQLGTDDEDMSICQVDLVPGAQEPKVTRSAVSYISSDGESGSKCALPGQKEARIVNSVVSHISSDGEHYDREDFVPVDEASSTGMPSVRVSELVSSFKEPPSFADAGPVSTRVSQECGLAMSFRRESSSRSRSPRPDSPRPSKTSEEWGVQHGSYVERRSSVASHASCDDHASEGMVSVQFKDGKPCPIDRTPSVRLLNGQPVLMDTTASRRSSGDSASGALARMSAGRQTRSSAGSRRNSQQPPTIWEASMESREDLLDKASSTGMPSVRVSELITPVQDEKASSTGMPSVRVSELVAPVQDRKASSTGMPSSRVSELRSAVQDFVPTVPRRSAEDPCPRLSEDTQMLQFQDTDGHVIALKRERSCVNLYVNTILEQVDVRYFIIDEQKRSYTVSQLEGDFKPHEDLKRLRALQDALFSYEDKALPSVSRKFSGNMAGGDNQDDGPFHTMLDEVPRRIKNSGRESPRESLRTSIRSSRSAPRESSEAAVPQQGGKTSSIRSSHSAPRESSEAVRFDLDQTIQSSGSATCGECSRQLESEHKSISDDESVERRYCRADCRFTRRNTSTYVGLTRFPKLLSPFAMEPRGQDISGTERSRVKVLLEKADHALKDHESRAAFADLPELLKGLGEAVVIHTRNILEVDGISVLDGIPVILLLFAKLVEVLDRIIPSDVAKGTCKETEHAVLTSVVWSGEMLNALRQGLSSTGFLPTCCDLLNGRYRQALQEMDMDTCEFTGELELHALLAVRLALTWIPPAHIQGPCDTFCTIDGHTTLMISAAGFLSMVRTKSSGNTAPWTLPTVMAHDCVGQLALVLESLLCGLRCDSSFMKFAFGQDQGRSSRGHENGTAQSVYGSKVVPLAPMALNALEVLSTMQAPGLERDRGAAVDAAATAALNLLAQLAEGPINTAVVPANSISTAVCYLLESKPLTVRLAAALRALICRPSHQPGWFIGKRKAKFDLELRAAFNAADLSFDLVHCTQNALTAGKDQACGTGDTWEEEAAVLKECTSKVCDLYGHVEAIIKELNENRPEELAELKASMPRCECCGGQSPQTSTSCGSDEQSPEQSSVFGKLLFLHCQIRQSWCLAPYLKY